MKVPLPDPGFKRSEALLQLISFLEQPKMVDYVVSHMRMTARCYRQLSDYRSSHQFICPPDEEKLVIIPPFSMC